MAAEEEVLYIGKSRMVKVDGIWYDDFHVKDKDEVTSMMECCLGDDDVLVECYPKSGTTWLLRILTLIKNEADIQKSDASPLDKSTKMIESDKPSAVIAEKPPRIMKTHLVYQHLPRTFREGKGKMIYIVRNPKDVCVSYYFFYKMLSVVSLDEPFDVYFERFMKGDVPYGPWSEHVKTFLEHRHQGNILWLTYEDLQRDIAKNISDISKFLGKNLSEEQIKTIADASSFKSMKSNPATDIYREHLHDGCHFLRKGIVGDWKNYFSAEMSQRVDEMVEKEISPLGISIRYE